MSFITERHWASLNVRHTMVFGIIFLVAFALTGGALMTILSWIIAMAAALAFKFVEESRSTSSHLPTKEPLAVILTGATSGIGFPTAVEFAKQGFTVFGTVRNLDSGERLMQAHSSIIPVVMDVTKPESIASASQVIERHLVEKNLALLAIVNNAGYAHFGFMEAATQTVLQNYHAVNIQGPILTTNGLLPLLRRFSPQTLKIKTQLKPKVIFVSSILSKYSVAGNGLIASTKHAIDAIAASYRQELSQQGIGVSVIAPGPIGTNLQPDFLPIKAKIADGLIDQDPSVKEYYELAEKQQDVDYKANNKTTGVMARSAPIVVAKLFVEAVTSPCPSPRYEAGRFAVISSIIMPWLWPTALDAMGTKLFTPWQTIKNNMNNSSKKSETAVSVNASQKGEFKTD